MARAPHRIAAGGIVFKDDSILLVRYRNPDGGTYLVAPGGALEDREDPSQAAVREIREETGISVVPRKILFIENLFCKRYQMIKIWVLCDPQNTDVQQTPPAQAEGIIAADWFSRKQLTAETVFPPPLTQYGWQDFQSDRWRVQCLPIQQTDF